MNTIFAFSLQEAFFGFIIVVGFWIYIAGRVAGGLGPKNTVSIFKRFTKWK